jgi:hypothetical protein
LRSIDALKTTFCKEAFGGGRQEIDIADVALARLFERSQREARSDTAAACAVAHHDRP